TISLQELTSSTLLCLMAKASPTQVWLWHRRLSYLNFNYVNLLSKKDVVIGLPKLKYIKDQICYSCEVSKAKRISFKSKAIPISKGRLNLLHMDLCGPMRDETLEVLKEFLTMIQRNLQASVITVRTDRETSVANDTSGLVPQQQKPSDYDKSDPVPQLQNVSSSADSHVPSQQELDLLFGPLYDEFFTAVSEYRWTKDHPLKQVRGNSLKPVQTRRQLATDPKMYMFALIVSIVEPKNIKEAMANST
nr:retrovirus-related Pol polyprotein from transposon TNT 1-94 [Tanacetum cinerariifolium]